MKKKSKVSKRSKIYPYRSKLEKRLAELYLGDYQYEPKSSIVDYTVPHKYTPDFVHKKYPNVYLEVKGYFKTSSECSKYVAVSRDNPSVELIFILDNPYKKAYPTCRKRKDGSILTIAEWCEKHKFLYYSTSDIPKAIINGDPSEHWIRNERIKRGYK